MRIVVAVDPGVHKGYAILDLQTGLIHAGVELTYVGLYAVFKQAQPDVIVIEHFDTTMSLTSDMLHTIECIGAVAGWCEQHRVTMFRQRPSQRKAFSPLAEQLVRVKPRVLHLEDATAHALRYAYAELHYDVETIQAKLPTGNS